MTLSRRASGWALAGLFVISFVLRAYRPISWPGQWLERSQAFVSALVKGNLDKLYQSYHPGVTTMALGGPAIRLLDKLTLDGSPLRVLFSWAFPPYATPTGERVTAAVMGLAVGLAVIIVATTWVLSKLGGWEVALAGGGLLTLAPYFLANSRVLHLDAMMSALMLLSALSLLAGLHVGQRRYLILSGLAGGLALLTKSPAVFLFPYTGLVLLTYLVIRLRHEWAGHQEGRARWLLREVWRDVVRPGLWWALFVVLPFALWPPMWLEPLQVLRRIYAQVEWSRTVPHPHQTLFAGRLYHGEQLTVLFYPTAMAFRSTFVTLTLGLVALGGYTIWRRRARLPVPPVSFWLLVAYAVFFVVQMSLSAKKIVRYVLPTQAATEILAAIGLVWLVSLLQAAVQEKRPRVGRRLPAMLIGLAIGLQALVTLPFAPDYGAHFNYLLGGNRVAVRMIPIMEQNEGIMYVGEYLGRQPGVEGVTVAVSYRSGAFSLRQYFPGDILPEMSPDAAYEYDLFYTIADQRQRYTVGAEAAWQTQKANTPALVVRFDGVDYLKLYQKGGSAKETEVVRRGWSGLIALAWIWTVALAGTLVWALRQERAAA